MNKENSAILDCYGDENDDEDLNDIDSSCHQNIDGNHHDFASNHQIDHQKRWDMNVGDILAFVIDI